MLATLRGLVLVLALGLDSAQAQEQARFRPDTQAIARDVSQFLSGRDVPSAVVGVYDAQGMIWEEAYGYADRGRRIRATVDTQYQIGSITKLFTATLAVILRDEGVIVLDDPVARWLDPGTAMPAPLPGGAPAISIRHLLTQSSGLPANPVNRVDVDGVMQPYSVRNLYAGLRETTLAAPTGTRVIYSNLGYGLLGYALERAAGVRYEDLLRQRLLSPLGMSATTITLSPAQERTLARHYWHQDERRQPQHRWVFGEVAGFGGLVSTVPDLARFLSMQLRADGTGPVSAASLEQMQRPQMHWQPTYDMGFAWQTWRSPGMGAILTHGGEVDGHGSYAAFSRPLGVGVIVLTNLGGPTSVDMGEMVLARVVADARAQREPTRAEAASLSNDEDWINAEWAWASVLRTTPDDGEAHFRRGVAAFNLNRFELAIAEFDEAVRLDAIVAGAHITAARALAALGRDDEAFARIRAAVRAGYTAVGNIQAHPEFSRLRGNPRWSALVDDAIAHR
ncbi:MAG: serine hydrolase [Terricaulis sp.]